MCLILIIINVHINLLKFYFSKIPIIKFNLSFKITFKKIFILMYKKKIISIDKSNKRDR